MPIPENAEQVCIPCRNCPREHFLYVDHDTRQVLAYHGSGTLVLSGESLPTACNRLLNAPCDECRRVRKLGPGFHSPLPSRRPRRNRWRAKPGSGRGSAAVELKPNALGKSAELRNAASRVRRTRVIAQALAAVDAATRRAVRYPKPTSQPRNCRPA